MKSFCKLQLNQELLKKSGELDDTDLYLIETKGQYFPINRFKLEICLNCEKSFKQIIKNNYVFCSTNCAKEYFLKKRGLL